MVSAAGLYSAQIGHFNLTANFLSGDKQQKQQETA